MDDAVGKQLAGGEGKVEFIVDEGVVLVAVGTLDVGIAIAEGYEGLYLVPVKRAFFVCERDCCCMCMEC